MNCRQLTAYKKPCHSAIEVIHPRFRSFQKIDEWLVSIILTVEVDLSYARKFGQREVWHSSVTFPSNEEVNLIVMGPKPVVLWTQEEKQFARLKLFDLLFGVGISEKNDLEFSIITANLRRPLTVEEIENLK